jgi:hypothetical protein
MKIRNKNGRIQAAFSAFDTFPGPFGSATLLSLVIYFMGEINPLDKYCLALFPEDGLHPVVMPGLDPGIHVSVQEDVDGRDKPGHDGFPA